MANRVLNEKQPILGLGVLAVLQTARPIVQHPDRDHYFPGSSSSGAGFVE